MSPAYSRRGGAGARSRRCLRVHERVSARLDQDGRKRIIEMLWEMAMADGVVHEFESNLVWRVSELLGVSARDRVTLKKLVASRVGCDRGRAAGRTPDAGAAGASRARARLRQ